MKLEKKKLEDIKTEIIDYACLILNYEFSKDDVDILLVEKCKASIKQLQKKEYISIDSLREFIISDQRDKFREACFCDNGKIKSTIQKLLGGLSWKQ